jgi:hypothetical protein
MLRNAPSSVTNVVLNQQQISASPALLVAKRSWAYFQFANFHGWSLPYGAKQSNVTKEDLQSFRYFNTRSRKQWDYNRIDENITSNSEFKDRTGRETFDYGMREDNSNVNSGSMHTPSHYSLHDHFDAYTKPGIDKKFAAAVAVKEQWDAEEFYYPGEAWQRNRPGFRSVPKELLNRDTWYHWTDMWTKLDEVQSTNRTRSWNPQWPPQGYKVPRLSCKKEFIHGAEEPGLVAEVERYYWYRMWAEGNIRTGPRDIFLFGFVFLIFYYYARQAMDVNSMRSMYSNLHYPGRNAIRPFGTPKDWETGCFWWQKPLEEFPNQGEIYHMNGMRFGYMRYLEKRDEREKIEAQL